MNNKLESTLWPPALMKDARDEAYLYFDQNIRNLAKDSNGDIDPTGIGLENNDIDAFRHAYVSGVFVQVFNEEISDILGRLNEYKPGDFYSNSKDSRSLNMDLWNNSIGRNYGLKAKDRKELLKLIHQALDNGELIINLNDKRKYIGNNNDPRNKSKPIIVLSESETGRNEIFFDLFKEDILSREEFVTKIKAGAYPKYFIKIINGVETPLSKPDSHRTNNIE